MKPITAKSDSGTVVSLVEHNGQWVRPAKWHDPEMHYDAPELNHQENKDRRTPSRAQAQAWADEMARRIP